MTMAVNMNVGSMLPELAAGTPADAAAPAAGEFAALLSGATAAPGMPAVPTEHAVSALHIQLATLTIAAIPADGEAVEGEAAPAEANPAALPIDLAALTTRLGDIQKLMKRVAGDKKPESEATSEEGAEAKLPGTDADKLGEGKQYDPANVIILTASGTPAPARSPQPVTIEGTKLETAAPVAQAAVPTLPSAPAAVPLAAQTSVAAVAAAIVEGEPQAGEDAAPALPLPAAPPKAEAVVLPLRAAVERIVQVEKAPVADAPARSVPTAMPWLAKPPVAKASKPEPALDVAAPVLPTPAPSALFTTASLQPQPGSLAPLQDAAAIDAPIAPEAPEMMIEHQLDMAHEAEWLDRLAKDIAQGAGNDGPLRFRLHPETLGTLRVEVQQSAAGTTVRLTAETEAARAIIADAQPKLMAEARAQGVRIAEAHVGMSPNGQQGEQRRQDDAQPFIRTASFAEVESDPSEGADAAAGERFA